MVPSHGRPVSRASLFSNFRPRGNAVVHLAVNPPVLPMLAKPVHALPDGERWLFEPKWDGFRALVFRDADELFRAAMGSRSAVFSSGYADTGRAERVAAPNRRPPTPR